MKFMTWILVKAKGSLMCPKLTTKIKVLFDQHLGKVTIQASHFACNPEFKILEIYIQIKIQKSRDRPCLLAIRETDIEDSFCIWDERNTEGLTANVDALGGKHKSFSSS